MLSGAASGSIDCVTGHRTPIDAVSSHVQNLRISTLKRVDQVVTQNELRAISMI